VVFAIGLIIVGLTVVMAGAGLLRFVPTFPDPGYRVPWRQRFGFDPAKRNRAQSTTLLIGGILFASGLAALVGILIYRATH
jgi:hypothetical protein